MRGREDLPPPPNPQKQMTATIITTAEILADPTAYNPDGQFIFDSGNFITNQFRRTNLQQYGGKEGMLEASMEVEVWRWTRRYRNGKVTREQAIEGLTKAHTTLGKPHMKALIGVMVALTIATPVLYRIPRIIMSQQSAPAVEYVAPAADYRAQ